MLQNLSVLAVSFLVTWYHEAWNSDGGKSNFGVEKSKQTQTAIARSLALYIPLSAGFLSWAWDFGTSSQHCLGVPCACRKPDLQRNRLDNPFYQFSPTLSMNGWHNPGFVCVNNTLLFIPHFPRLFWLHTRISWVFVVSVLNLFNVA